MTAFKNCSPTDRLNQHDTYRLTFVPSGLLTSLSGTSTLGTAMGNLFQAGTIDGITTYVQPLNANPYQDGDMAETVDILVESAGGAVSDMLGGILAVMNQYSVWSSADWGSVSISTCEQVVGPNASAAGSPDASAAVYSPAAASARVVAAQSAAATVASTDWLTNLENDLGVAGKYVLFGAAGLILLALYQQGKRFKVFG